MSQDFLDSGDQKLEAGLDPVLDSLEEKGTITYATEVIATIVGVATAEVEGIASMAGSASISELFSGKPKNLSRGVRVEVGAEEVAVDVSVTVDYGMPIQAVGRNVQENIRKSIESMTGLRVLKVDVHVLGVSFEKENKELEQGQEVARLQSSSENQSLAGLLPEGAPESAKASQKHKRRIKKEPAEGAKEQSVQQSVEPPADPDAATEDAVHATDLPEGAMECPPKPEEPVQPAETDENLEPDGPQAGSGQKNGKKDKRGGTRKTEGANEAPKA